MHVRTLSFALLPLISALADAAQLPQSELPQAGDRVLVVAPHPDDGALCCSGYVQRAVARGAEVGFVWLTAGDAFEIDAIIVNRRLHEKGAGMILLGLTRIQEAFTAARSLGVPREHMRMLGYPDAGLSALLGEYYDTVYVSRYTRSGIVPYGEAVSFGGEITGRNLERDLARAIDDFRPTIVFAPDIGDIHPDHSKTGELTQRLLVARGERARLHRYVVHADGRWPAPRALRTELPLDPPAALTGLPWRSFVLTDAEQQGKLRALRLYETQWKVMAPYLESFVRRNELFAD